MSGTVLDHNQRSASVWSSGGDDYDEISRQISSALEHCVCRLDPKPDERVLDIATGTGWTSRLIARRGANVVGVDIAQELLAAAKERAFREGLRIEYVMGDAEKLPFDDAAFDAVVSTFGVMFVSRPEEAANEIARICRKGGRIALATWPPDGAVFKMFSVMRAYMPTATPAPPSPFAWGRPERLRELFERNFELKFEQGVTNYYDRSGAAAWNAFVTGYGPTKALASSLDQERRTALARDFTAFHDGFPTELGICVPR